MTLFLPQPQQSVDHNHFTRPLPVAILQGGVTVRLLPSEHPGATSRQVRVVTDLPEGDEAREYLENKKFNEPRHEKTNILVSDLVRHKPGCTATEDS